jgi:hypothetical protein
MFNTAYKAYNNLIVPDNATKEEPVEVKKGLLTRNKEAMPIKQMAKSEYERVANYVASIRAKREAMKSDGK